MRASQIFQVRPRWSPRVWRALAALGCLYTSLGLCTSVVAQSQEPASASVAAPTQVPAGTPPASSPSQGFREYKEALSSERQLLETQAERHFSRLDKLLDRIVWGLGVMGAIAVGLMAWFLGATRKELKESIHDFVQSHGRDIFAALLTPYEQRLNELNREVQVLRAYQDRKIVWLQDAEINNQFESDTLRLSGFRNIEMRIPSDDGPLNLGRCDLVILSFNGSNEASVRLHQIVDELAKRSPPIPLLVYTFNPKGREVKLDTPAFNILKRYPWGMTVNYPLSLLANVQALLRVSGGFPGGDSK